jgi:hypothetical protein
MMGLPRRAICDPLSLLLGKSDLDGAIVGDHLDLHYTGDN